jgi:hypothetical protein
LGEGRRHSLSFSLSFSVGDGGSLSFSVSPVQPLESRSRELEPPCAALHLLVRVVAHAQRLRGPWHAQLLTAMKKLRIVRLGFGTFVNANGY